MLFFEINRTQVLLLHKQAHRGRTTVIRDTDLQIGGKNYLIQNFVDIQVSLP